MLGPSGLLNSSELYDPDTETWTGRVVPVITGTLVSGKRLVLFGENFGPDAGIRRNGIGLQTKKSGDTRKRVAKKGAIKIKPGDKLQVLNPDGALSKEFTFTSSRAMTATRSVRNVKAVSTYERRRNL